VQCHEIWFMGNLLFCCQDSKVVGPPEYWHPTPTSIFRVENSYLPKRWKQLLPLNCWCHSTKLHPIWSHKATIWYSPQYELHISHSIILDLKSSFNRFWCLVLSSFHTRWMQDDHSWVALPTSMIVPISADIKVKVLYLSHNRHDIPAQKCHGIRSIYFQ
jgi:hypothetical protein